MFIYSTADMRGQGSNEGGGRGRGRGGRRGGTLSHAEGLASTTPLEELHTSIRPSTESSSVHSTSSTQAATTSSLPVESITSTMSTLVASASGRTQLIVENGR